MHTMISDAIQAKLEQENLSLHEFKELIIRLLNYGVLCRNENLTEQQLYDRYLRVAPLVNDYLYMMDVRVYHEPRFEYLRLYPPASQIPGMEDAERHAFGGSLRSRMRQEEVTLILVLNVQYDKVLYEGQVDENGYVTESLEALSIAMKNLLGRNLPDKVTDRRRLFQRMRQLRLIEYRQDEDIESGEAWIKIHPMIVSFVNEDAMQALSADKSDLSNPEAGATLGDSVSRSTDTELDLENVPIV